MAKRVSVDGWLFTVTLILVFVGLVMVFSASAVMAKERYGSGYFFLLRQVAWAAGRNFAMLVAMKVDYRRYKHPGVVFSVLGVTTLLLISVFFLDRAHNTHRWIHFGGFSFQPSEVAKPALILFLAYFLENRTKSMNDWRNTLLPGGLPTLIFLVLIVLQPDLGTAIACAAITACILFVAGLDLRYLGYAFLASLLPLYFLIFHVAWRRDRILAFLNPYSDPQGNGFHIIQSLIAVSTGGVTGLGFMEGKQKLFYLPEPHTDFIFAVTAEELGLLGALVLRVALRNFSMARNPNRLAHPGHVRPLARRGHYQHGGGAGLHQHQRSAGNDADQRHSAALRFLWRFVAVRHAGLRRSAAEHHQANRLSICVSRFLPLSRRHPELAKDMASSRSGLWARTVQIRARSFGTEVPQNDAGGGNLFKTNPSQHTTLVANRFGLWDTVGMTKRNLRVLKWLGQVPAIGVCTVCDRQFQAPMTALR